MTPRPRHTPGSWLRHLAQLIFDEETMARVVGPTLADLDHEVREAGDDLAARRTALLRGYVAFWKLAVLSPFVFADWPGRRQFAQSLTHIGAILVLLVLTFGGQSAWMMRLLKDLYPRVSATLISVAGLGPFVWLLAPIAVAIFAVLGRRSPFRASPTAVILVCSATVAAAASYGAAGFVAVFDKIGREGSAGFSSVYSAVDALAIPSLLALGITAVTAVVISVSQGRARTSTTPNAAPTTAVSGTAAFVLAVSMAASLVAVNQWLVINEDLLGVALAMTNPTRAASSGGSAALISQTEIALPLMLLGLVISLTILATAFAAWRGSRTRRPNHLLVWSTRFAVVAMLAGCVWHAGVIGGQWRTFRTETTAHLAR